MFDFFFSAWTIFVLATVIGARCVYQGLTGTVPRDLTGDYRYAGPAVFVVAGCLLQLPLLFRFALYLATGG